MNIPKTMVSQGWALILLIIMVVIGYSYISEWPIEVLAAVLAVILVIGLATAVVRAEEKEFEHLSQRLRALAGYFYCRFMGNSSLAIVEQFYVIAQKIELPQETTDQYRKFATKYNTFAKQFRGLISEFKKIARTEIEPPNIKLASELSKCSGCLPRPLLTFMR